MVRVSACHAESRGFKSHHPRSRKGLVYKLIMKVSELNVNNLVRSVVVLVLGAPVVLGVSTLFKTASENSIKEQEPSAAEVVIAEVKGELTRPCLNYAISKDDSKLERDAKNEIDEYFGGEVNYQTLCQWVTS